MGSLYVDGGYVNKDYVQTGITVLWKEKIIFIPIDEMSLVQETPTVIRALDLNYLRLSLKALEADETGICYLDTHRHYPPTTVGGVTLARVIEIINGYTVTFEDGKYAVNLYGANSNVADVTNVNQVSVRSQNSAGLTSLPVVEYASFEGGVTYDPSSPYSGTIFPTGTARQPVNNTFDAKIIADYRGLYKWYIINYMVLDYIIDLHDFTFVGKGGDRTLIHVGSEANVTGCTFIKAYVTGVLDGYSKLIDCLVGDLEYINGYMEDCVLRSGTIVLGGSETAFLFNCGTGSTDNGCPVIDCGGSGQGLVIRNYAGCFKVINKNGPEYISIDLNSGVVEIDLNTVTNGMLTIRGVGELVDLNGDPIMTGVYGNLRVYNYLLNSDQITETVWSDTVAQVLLDDVSFIKDIEGGRWRIKDQQMIFYASDNSTEVARFNLFSKTGAPADDNVYERVRV